MGPKGSKDAKAVRSSTALTPHEIAMIKANTKFDDKQIQEWHASFIRDNPTGKLDKKSFVNAYREFYPKGNPESYCKYAFATFDANNDGTIDFDEFILAIAVKGQGSVEDRLAAAFDLYDISGDGQIDQKELTNLITAMYDLVGETNRAGDRDPKKRAADIIKQLDVTEDKKLSKQEFIAGCKSDQEIKRLLAPDVGN